jgi:chloride channel protein, CIC family
MFLVRRAREVMDTDFVLASASTSFDTFLREPGHRGRLRHVVVSEGERIVGVLRVNTALRRGSEALQPSASLREVATRSFTIVRDSDVIVDVMHRLWSRQASMALVVQTLGKPRARDVVGVLTKEHVADSVAHSTRVYPMGAD